jgi:ribonuclease BN (tRNA processing enzyme)
VVGVVVTHFHVDHCGDLSALLFARNVVDPPPVDALRLAGPVGHAAHVAGLRALYEPALEDRRGLTSVEELRDGEGVTIAPFHVSVREVMHVPGALGVRIACGGRTLAFSGDSGECDALDALCRGADLALLECSYPADRPSRTHLTTHGAARTALRAGVKRLALVHFYPSCDAVDREREVRAGGYVGDLHLGEDGDVLDV